MKKKNKTTYNYIEKSLTFYIERYILDDDGSWNDFIVWICGNSTRRLRRPNGRIDMDKRGRTASGRKVRVVVGRKRSPL
jgi:hypothetical protein